jgi:hypothetical protein
MVAASYRVAPSLGWRLSAVRFEASGDADNIAIWSAGLMA